MFFLKSTSLRRVLSTGFLAGFGLGFMPDPAKGQDNPLPPLEPVSTTTSVVTPAPTTSPRPLLDAFADLTSFAKDLPPTLLESARQRAESFLAEARGHRAADRWRAALDATGRAIAADPSLAVAHQLRAEVYADKTLYAHAIAALHDGLACCPHNALLWGYRGVLRSTERDPSGGLADIDTAMQIAAGDPSTLAWLRSCRARVLGDLGNSRECITALNEAEAAGETDPNLILQRGSMRFKLRDFDGALADIEQAMTLAPNATTTYHRGAVRLRAGHFAAALADYEAIRADFATDPTVQCEYGIALFAAGRRADAIAHLDSLLRQDPDDRLCQTARGWFALLGGDLQLAHTLLNQVSRAGTRRAHFDIYADSSFLTDPEYDAILTDFEARCRVAPYLPFALYFRTGAEARTKLLPRPMFHVALVCRFLRDPSLAPTVIAQFHAVHLDQPWRPAANLGEVIAAACLLDRARLRQAGTHLATWLASNPTP